MSACEVVVAQTCNNAQKGGKTLRVRPHHKPLCASSADTLPPHLRCIAIVAATATGPAAAAVDPADNNRSLNPSCGDVYPHCVTNCMSPCKCHD